jgi:adenylosuccinate lyase
MDKGLTRSKAYDLVQAAAMKTWKEGSEFKTNLLLDKEVTNLLTEKELDHIFDLNYYLRNVDKIFSRVFSKK